MPAKARKENTDKKNKIAKFPPVKCSSMYVRRDNLKRTINRISLTMHILFHRNYYYYLKRKVFACYRIRAFVACGALRIPVRQSWEKSNIFYQGSWYCWKTHWHIHLSIEKGQKRDHMPKSISVFFLALSANPIKRQDLSPQHGLCLLDSCNGTYF